MNIRRVPQQTYIMYYLDVRGHKGVLRLGIHPNEEEKSYIHIEFDKLRKILGDKFPEYIDKLSAIPGFDWIKKSAYGPFTWKCVENIAVGEPDYSKIKEELRKLLLKLLK